MATIFTIGHSTRSQEDFLGLLKAHGIGRLVDIRAFPASRRHPQLVADFARRLANRLNLPFVDALQKVRETTEQRTMENSAQQMANVADAFVAVAGAVRGTPVLLLDDMVDSRWTLTECAMVLRRAGSGAVHPLALTSTAASGDSA